jgi:hypothetical protein
MVAEKSSLFNFRKWHPAVDLGSLEKVAVLIATVENTKCHLHDGNLKLGLTILG